MDKINVLVEYPEKIFVQESDLLDKEDLLGKGRIEIKKFEVNIENEVELEALNPENKEKLSNATKRTNEVRERLTYNRTYNELIDKMSKLKKEIEIQSLRVARDKRVFRAAVALCSLVDRGDE